MVIGTPSLKGVVNMTPAITSLPPLLESQVTIVINKISGKTRIKGIPMTFNICLSEELIIVHLQYQRVVFLLHANEFE